MFNKHCLHCFNYGFTTKAFETTKTYLVSVCVAWAPLHTGRDREAGKCTSAAEMVSLYSLGLIIML